MSHRMISDEEFERMLQHARKRDAEMERIEAGDFAPPKRCDLHSHLRTVEQALECAVKMNDWPIACEAIVLLQQAIVRVAPRGQNQHIQ
jgi:hypothetical protein